MDLGKLLIAAGLAIAALGLLMKLGVGFGWLGRLPGDIHIQRDGFCFHFPVVTCLLLSLVLTLLFRLIRSD